jgi:hypothetical protein
MPNYLNVQNQTSNSIQLRCDSSVTHVGEKFFIKLQAESGMAADIIEIQVVSLT